MSRMVIESSVREAGTDPIFRPEYEPPGFVKGGLHGKLVMLKGQIGFGGSIVGIFRADMLDRCHRLHLSLSAPRI